MIKTYNNMSISLKISVAFGLIIGLLVLSAGMMLYALRTFETSFTDHRAHVGTMEQARDIEFAIVDLRRNVDAFVVSGSPTARKIAEEAINATQSAIDNALSTDDAATREAISRISSLFGAYKANFQKMADLRFKKESLVREQVETFGDKLKNEVVFFAAKIDKLGKPELAPIANKAIEQYNAGRLAVYKLMNTGLADDLKAADTSFAGFVQRLNLLVKSVDDGSQELAQLNKTLKSSEAFQTAYHAAAQASDDLSKLLATDMRDSTNAITDAAATIRSSAAGKSEEIGLAAAKLAVDVRTIILSVAGGSAFLALLLAVIVGRSISRPIVAFARAMQRVSDGDLLSAVPGVGRKDEVGVMADTLEMFKTSLSEAEQARAAREADAATQAVARRRELHQLAETFEQAVGGIANSLASAAVQLNGSAEVMSRSSSDVTQMASVVAGASEEANRNVGTVAAAAEELASSIAEIGRQVNESTEVASQAVTDASDTAAKVRELSDAAKKIGSVVDLINNIAGQTNLLALNATIEAARAGEAGKGFAVVAAEVKQLADQTSKATNEIASQIATIQASTAESSDAIMRITATIDHISDVSNQVASAVRDQGIATQEIAASVQKAASGTGAVSSNIGQVNTAAQNSATAAGEVLHASEALSSQARSLQDELVRFLGTIRAA
jgi:methyl-accepting chemotaxis protein